MKHKILLIEDDEILGGTLLSILTNEGFDVVWKKDFKSAFVLDVQQMNLIILDWMLTDGQGIDLLKKYRESSNVPVIMLTARVDLIDKVIGLESGANDYMTKPFEPRELIARMRVQLRGRNESIKSQKLTHGALSLDLIEREVLYKDSKIVLTKMEFDLLKILMETPKKVFSRESLLDKVWGYENYPTTRTVDTHVLTLRQKIDDSVVETVRGLGYKLGTVK